MTVSPSSIEGTVMTPDGVSIRTYDLGGEGPLLLFCHATGFCGQVWQPFAESLHDRFHCVALDFRGHGRSGMPPDDNFAWSGMAADVLAVKAAIQPDAPVAAIGHSMGGTALILAESINPGTLTKAWTFEPILLEDITGSQTAEPSAISQAARYRRASFASRSEAIERYASKPPLGLLDRRVLQAYGDHGFADQSDGTVTLRCAPESEAAVFENHFSGALERCGDLQIPFAVGISGDDGIVTEALGHAVQRYPNLEVLSYPGLTHFGPLQDPNGMANAASAWLEQGD